MMKITKALTAKIEKLTALYKEKKLVEFEGKAYPLFTPITGLPPIEHIRFEMDVLAGKLISPSYKPTNLTFVSQGILNLRKARTGDLFLTSSKNIWGVLQEWSISKNGKTQKFILAARIYPTKGEKFKFMYEHKEGKSSLDIKVQKIHLKLTKQGKMPLIVRNLKQYQLNYINE